MRNTDDPPAWFVILFVAVWVALIVGFTLYASQGYDALYAETPRAE